jgi:3'-phosphoadenosine 5'-phosphosulfate (PAPS) 3'-phosphatase
MNDMDEARWASDLRLVLEAARKAGETALGFFRKDPEVWWKNGGLSPVSAADYAANEILETILRSARPDYGWLSEETDDDTDRLSRSTVFVVDPIDGTRAFIGGRDTWCISVAVVHEGRPVVGVLVAPALSEEFTAMEAPSPQAAAIPAPSISPPRQRRSRICRKRCATMSSVSRMCRRWPTGWRWWRMVVSTARWSCPTHTSGTWPRPISFSNAPAAGLPVWMANL